MVWSNFERRILIYSVLFSSVFLSIMLLLIVEGEALFQYEKYFKILSIFVFLMFMAYEFGRQKKYKEDMIIYLPVLYIFPTYYIAISEYTTYGVDVVYALVPFGVITSVMAFVLLFCNKFEGLKQKNVEVAIIFCLGFFAFLKSSVFPVYIIFAMIVYGLTLVCLKHNDDISYPYCGARWINYGFIGVFFVSSMS